MDLGNYTAFGADLPTQSRAAGRVGWVTERRISIIVPVFNNGELLRTRAFPSLVRLPEFEQLHILLIDDGSTYQDTRSAVAELAAAHSNVTAEFLPLGGSGSASRPRNSGFDLADTEYLGFLDPDDEFLGTGPWPLAAALDDHSQAQLAVGNQQRIYTDRTEHVTNTAHYAHLRLAGGDGEIFRAGAEVLARARFRPSNLSSYLLRTAWLTETGIRQVVGSAGQDSLFFRQVFAAAEAWVPVREEIYAYHAQTEGSMVNTVTPGYFEKCLIRERAQADWLAESGLLGSYLRHGFEPTFAWYLPKLRQVPREQRPQARAILRQIAELYVDPRSHHWRYPEVMAFFRRPGLPSAEGVKPLAARALRRFRSAGSTPRGLGR